MIKVDLNKRVQPMELLRLHVVGLNLREAFDNIANKTRHFSVGFLQKQKAGSYKSSEATVVRARKSKPYLESELLLIIDQVGPCNVDNL
jgi:hypothetical protein